MKKSTKSRKKKVIRVNLPLRMEFTDYHSLSETQDVLRTVIPGVKVKEIGCDGYWYIGVAYLGSLRDPAVKEIVKSIKSELVKCDF